MRSIYFGLAMLSVCALLAAVAIPAHAADAAVATTTTAAANSPTTAPTTTPSTEPALDFFGDKPIADAALVHVPPPKPQWMTVGGPIALFLFFLGLIYSVYKFIPFRDTPIHFDLHDLPVAAQRGIGMAVILFGIAFVFGIAEIHYQLGLHDSAEAYFQAMSLGKLIAMTHAHMFGFTTSFFIIGIPFSLHFHHLKIYQWIFPLGLAASLCDIISWWGLRFISGNFEYITWWCGLIFGICYGWILIGLVRVIFFPNFHWAADYLNDEKKADPTG